MRNASEHNVSLMARVVDDCVEIPVGTHLYITNRHGSLGQYLRGEQMLSANHKIGIRKKQLLPRIIGEFRAIGEQSW